MPSSFRFRRRVRIAPGVRLNIAKRGLSTSFGPRGMHLTLGDGRVRTTLGIPGTGLSCTTYTLRRHRTSNGTGPTAARTALRDTAALVPTEIGRLGIAGYQGMTPPDRIALGALLCALVIGVPVGIPLLIIGLRQMHDPLWQMRTYTKWAARDPARAGELIARAGQAMPDSPELIKPLASLYLHQGDYAAALPYLRRWSAAAPGDAIVLGALATAALKSGALGEAITALQQLREEPGLTPDSHASVTAHLAYAHLCHEDLQPALMLVSSVRAQAGKGAEQCLFYRAVAKYLLGHTGLAIVDLDRLYSLDPTYEGLAAARDAMQTGTYQLLLPDGSALIQIPNQQGSQAAVVQRLPAGPHCLNCSAPAHSGDTRCPYCGAAPG
jgi:tetratricopeptide (TPR) repeat protein